MSTGLRPIRSLNAPLGKFSRIRASVKALISKLTSAIDTPKFSAKRGSTGPTMCQFKKTVVMRQDTTSRYSLRRAHAQTLDNQSSSGGIFMLAERSAGTHSGSAASIGHTDAQEVIPMRRLALLAIPVLALLTAACSTALKAPEAAVSGQSARPANAELRGQPASTDTAGGSSSAASAPASAGGGRSSSGAAEAAIPPLDRMVIANVNLSVSVDNAVEAARLAERTVERYGGFVAGSTVRDSDNGREANVTVRVPSARLSEALSD